MKLSKSVSLFLLTLGLLTPLSSQALCLFKCKPSVSQNPDESLRINPTESIEQAKAAEEALVELQNDVRARFTLIEDAIQRGETSKALRESKVILDMVKVKIGIDPKVKMRESFWVNTEFAENAMGFDDLTETQQYLVINTIRNFRGGIYMELMNLSKRVSLIYSRAFKAELAKQGGLNQEDRNKILKDLVTASLVPMPIVDRNNKKITVFDEDVANEDHVYLFNRELKIALLNDKDLKISEESFNDYKNQVRSSLNPKSLKSNTSAYEAAVNCMTSANEIGNFYDRNEAKTHCFKVHEKQFENRNQCMNIAAMIDSNTDKNNHQLYCVKTFSK